MLIIIRMIIIGDIQHTNTTNTTNNIIIGHWNWSQNNRKVSGGSLSEPLLSP
jgi:hypothetical protein